MRAGRETGIGEDARAAAERVVRSWFAAWNRADQEALRDLLHLPSVSLQANRLLVRDTEPAVPGETDFGAPGLDGWHHSTLDSFQARQHGEDKAHAAITFSRCATNGQKYADGQAICIVTRRRGRWAIHLYSGTLRPVGIGDGHERGAVAAATRVVQDWYAAGDRRDLAAMRSLRHVPHVELGGARLIVRRRASETRIGLREPAARTPWHRSVVERLAVCERSAQKVTLAATVARFDAGGGRLDDEEEEALHVVTERDGRWGIQVTSRIVVKSLPR